MINRFEEEEPHYAMEEGDQKMGDFRDTLRQELARRCNLNPRYSLRAFARDLGLAPSRLSEILSGKQGLSRMAATSICIKLGFGKAETATFCDLVEAKHARSRIAKRIAQERLSTAQRNPYRELEVDSFQVIADWYHLAILELLQVEGIKGELSAIARRLSLSIPETQVAVERMLRIGLLQVQDGLLVATGQGNRIPGGVPSDSVKKFHRQLMEKAIQALFLQPLETREFVSNIVSINPEKLPLAKQMIREFVEKFSAAMDEGTGKTGVYCLSLQFHQLTQDTTEARHDPK